MVSQAGPQLLQLLVLGPGSDVAEAVFAGLDTEILADRIGNALGLHFLGVAVLGGLFHRRQIFLHFQPPLKPILVHIAPAFLGGGLFCYFVVFPFAFTFFMSYSTDNIVAMLSINEYLSFALKMLIAFGLIFEMPLFSFFLARLGIISAQWMRDVRKYAVLAVFIIAAS